MILSFQFEILRRQSNYQEPYVTIMCPGQCSTSYALDYAKYCTCLILYFMLSPKYVRHLPHFNGNFYSEHLANKYVPTDPTMTDPTVTPSLRTPCKVTVLGVAHRVCHIYHIEIFRLSVFNRFFQKKLKFSLTFFDRCCWLGCGIFWDVHKIEMKSLLFFK